MIKYSEKFHEYIPYRLVVMARRQFFITPHTQTRVKTYGLDKIQTRAVVGQRSSPAGCILYCNIFIIKPYNIGHTDLAVFVCKSFCHTDIIIQV